MGKNKLKKFEENKTFAHLFQPTIEHVIKNDFPLKRKWKTSFFKNDNSLVLELGCGKGEYTVEMARSYPEKNFIGVDIKGARLWKGASEVAKEKIKNAAFIRTRIELIESFFSENEVDEIWITFPDPQLKKRRAKKRLTSSNFINRYLSFLRRGGLIHLKTDSDALYDYTLALLQYNKIPLIRETRDVYHDKLAGDALSVQTHYEKIWISRGIPIKYLVFSPDTDKQLLELPNEDEGIQT